MRVRALMILFLLAALASVVSAPVAVATTYIDPRDARGGNLDFKRLESSWERASGHVTYDFELTMWERWGLRDLSCFSCALGVWLDSRGDQRADFVVRLVVRDNEVQADIYALRPRRYVTTEAVAKDPRSVHWWISRSVLRPTRRVRWYAWSLQGGIDDRGPDGGWLWVR